MMQHTFFAFTTHHVRSVSTLSTLVAAPVSVVADFDQYKNCTGHGCHQHLQATASHLKLALLLPNLHACAGCSASRAGAMQHQQGHAMMHGQPGQQMMGGHQGQQMAHMQVRPRVLRCTACMLHSRLFVDLTAACRRACSTLSCSTPISFPARSTTLEPQVLKNLKIRPTGTNGRRTFSAVQLREQHRSSISCSASKSFGEGSSVGGQSFGHEAL